MTNGGQGEIRTPGSIARTHPFQGCTIDHSDTCPHKYIIYYLLFSLVLRASKKAD